MISSVILAFLMATFIGIFWTSNDSIQKYSRKVWHSIDCLLNAVFNGDPKVPVSATIYFLSMEPENNRICKIIVWVADLLSKDFMLQSYMKYKFNRV